MLEVQTHVLFFFKEQLVPGKKKLEQVAQFSDYRALLNITQPLSLIHKSKTSAVRVLQNVRRKVGIISDDQKKAGCFRT